MVGAVFLELFLLAGAGAASPPTDVDVRAAVAAYEQLAYELVERPLTRALEKPQLTAEDRRTALAYLGRVHAVFKRQGESERAFFALLTLEPTFEIGPLESPLIQTAFTSARRNFDATLGAAPMARPRPSPEPTAPTPGLATTPPPPGPERPGLSRWAWVGIGTGAVVAITAVALAITRPWQDDPAPSSTRGLWELP